MVQITPMQFLAAKSLPKMTGLVLFTLLQVIGKTVPVAGPTAIVQVSTKCVLVLFTSV